MSTTISRALVDHRRSSTLRPRRGRVVGMLAVLAALCGVVFTTASPASALGYAISYSVHNATSQTLYFESANGGGAKCVVTGTGTGTVVCFEDKGNYEAQVSPRVVPPGSNIGLHSEIDAFSFQQRDRIVVTYRIGTSANDKVVLYTDPNSAKCTVHGTSAYKCTVIPVGVGRDFVLSPA